MRGLIVVGAKPIISRIGEESEVQDLQDMAQRGVDGCILAWNVGTIGAPLPEGERILPARVYSQA